MLPWQTCTGCLNNTAGVVGETTHGTRAGSDPGQMKSVSHLLKGCHLSYLCLAEPALYRDLLYYSAGLIFLFMTTLPWRPSISLQSWRMTITEWYFIVIYNSQLQTQTRVCFSALRRMLIVSVGPPVHWMKLVLKHLRDLDAQILWN